MLLGVRLGSVAWLGILVWLRGLRGLTKVSAGPDADK